MIMAQVFCSIKQAADRLNKTEEELKEIVKQGKLRGFPDGPKLFLKVDEVESLVLDEGTGLGGGSLVTAEHAVAGPSRTGIGAAPKALEVEAPALQTLAIETPVVRTAEPEVKEILQAPEPKTAESESRILYAAEFVRMDKKSSLRRLSMRQWLLKGLRQDNAVAVVVFGLLLCVIFLAFIVLGYVLYAM